MISKIHLEKDKTIPLHHRSSHKHPPHLKLCCTKHQSIHPRRHCQQWRSLLGGNRTAEEANNGLCNRFPNMQIQFETSLLGPVNDFFLFIMNNQIAYNTLKIQFSVTMARTMQISTQISRQLSAEYFDSRGRAAASLGGHAFVGTSTVAVPLAKSGETVGIFAWLRN